MVVTVRHLDHQLGVEVAQERHDLLERHGVGEGQVVDDRQGEDQVGPHPLHERQPLPRAPAEAG
jgi:hypothetical protein